MTMLNNTYELRNLYLQQSRYSVEQVKPDIPLFLQWPLNGYFERLQPDADLLQKALNPETDYRGKTVSEQILVKSAEKRARESAQMGAT
jgi:hypothetical protein